MVGAGPDDSLRSGEPGIGWVYRPQMRIGGAGDFWFTTRPLPVAPAVGQAANEPNFAWAEGEARAPGKPFEAKLETVTFSSASGNNFTVVAEPGDAAYAGGPQWNDPNLDGTITVAGEHQVPVGFVRSTPAAGTVAAVVSKVKVSATFKVPAPGVAPNNVWIRGDGPGLYDVPWTKATVAGDTITLPPTDMSAALSNKVDHFPSFDIKWQYSTFAGLGGRDAGTSKNEMFVTFTKPSPATTMYVTPLWLYCKSAKGSVEINDSITKAFDNGFAGRVVTTHKDLDPLRADVAVPIHYYDNWKTANGTFDSMIKSATKDGICGAWVELFKFTLTEGGIPLAVLNPYRISTNTPLPGTQIYPQMFIKDWTFVGAGTTGVANFPYWAKFNKGDSYKYNPGGDSTGYDIVAASEIIDGLTGISGQNSTNPASIFAMHAVVRIADTIYDPSYGKRFSSGAMGWDASCMAWEAASLAGVGTPYSYTQAGVTYPGMAVAKASTVARNTKFEITPWTN